MLWEVCLLQLQAALQIVEADDLRIWVEFLQVVRDSCTATIHLPGDVFMNRVLIRINFISTGRVMPRKLRLGS